MIKAVFFDYDNTLYDFERVRRHGLSVALQHLHERLPDTRGRISVDHLMRFREEAAAEVENPEAELTALRRESFRRALALCGYDDALVPELFRVYVDHRFRVAVPYEGAVTALSCLRGRYALGIISNGNTPLSILGLDAYFDHTLYADDVGFQKPDPRIFQAALDRVPCAADELLYVGDSIAFDVMGAMNAGARSVWFNPRGEPYPDGLARPDFEIGDLGELVEVVDKL